jgi:hypothetical protein
MKRQLVQFLFLCLLANLIFGCDGDNSTSSNRHPYAGVWNVVFVSDKPGHAEIAIHPDGEFFGEARFQELPPPAGMHKYPLSGRVSNSGTVTDAKFYDWANDIHDGSFVGTFSGNQGNGTYEYVSTGTWTANKIR